MASTPPTPSGPPSSQDPGPPAEQSFFRQPGPKLVLGGGVFALVSALTTRRALARRRRPPILGASTNSSGKPRVSPIVGGIRPKGSNAPRMQWPGEKNTPLAENDMISSEMKDDQNQLSEAEAGGSGQESYTHAQNASSKSSQQDSTNSNEPNFYDTGPFLALEALSLATINVIAWGMLTTGFGLWYYDIKGIKDMQNKIRGGIGVDGTGRSEKELEEEMEEWVVGVLERTRNKKSEDDGLGVRDGKGRLRGVNDKER
ncbi:MAG: hypothetical protein M1831_000610 [Alyxoria varia]|nr:MAG: hypothetical protein M1831_000610 [Alyxoria varia]